ncbi:trifunctional serine/threonine-protein kinase/ATP-binding protein/sensor histidine kinase [Alicyclobacillus tolerans]|uniref:histidine kinase n=1 Tax=Alicyclobacillus tolerans TaxID=90970 RepID=A0ABT9LYS8_9BACL|nr:ATP-binding protein [Alicyclobacillus tengchongensis]MDP9729430.1 putative ATPase/signal transduction histidine kinase [Alicyclobacillus tengchongensis]
MPFVFHIPGCDVTETLNESSHTLVLRAIESSTSRPVILKMPATRYPQPSEIAKYSHEYEILQELNGEGAIRVYRLLQVEHVPVLILEDSGTESLSGYLRKHKLSIAEKLELAISLCECLERIHTKRITHRDLNPANILVQSDHKSVKIIDFGESTRFLREQVEAVRSDALTGTLPYMSPEQTGRMNRSVDYRTDIYSLGVTLYEMFTEHPPFDFSDALEMIHAHLAREPKSPDIVDKTIPRVLSSIILKCLSKNPEDRYQSAYGVRADLQICLEHWKDKGNIPHFPIGLQDAVMGFHPSRKLYERDDVWQQVVQAHERAAAGGVEFFIIRGEEGMGKSMLLSEFSNQLREMSSYVVGGTFHKDDQNIPYSAILQSCGQLFEGLLELPDDVVNVWKDRLVSILKDDVPYVQGLIPFAKQVFGGQGVIPSLNEAAYAVLMERILKNLFRAFANSQEAIVVYLDDCQWADSYTRKFLSSMASDVEFHHMLFLMTYRTEDVIEESLFARGRGSFFVSYCKLRPLSVKAVAELLADTLLTNEERVLPLAKIMVEKTSGNAFFVHQLLDSIYRSSFLWYDNHEKVWRWDIEGVRRIHCTDNVVDFLSQSLSELPEEERVWLGQTACFGAKFEIHDCAFIAGVPLEKAYERMLECLEYGFIEPVRTANSSEQIFLTKLEDTTWDKTLILQFAHARIQEAVYSLLDPVVKAHTHFKIAQYYLRKLSSEELVQRVFELAAHFNAAIDVIQAREIRQQAAEINLLAGREANRLALFDEANRFFTAGAAFLDELDWKERYGLTSQLYIERMKHEFLCNHYDHTLTMAEEVLAHAQTPLDKLEAHMCKLNVFTMRYEYASMMDTARSAVQLYGIKLPKRMSRRVALEQYRTFKQLVAVGEERMLTSSPKADKALQIVLRIVQVTSNSVTSQPEWISYLWLKVAELSIKYGFCPDSAIGFLAPVHLRQFWRKEDIEDAYRWGNFAREVVERFRDGAEGQYMRAKMNVSVTFATTLNHWRNHLMSTVDALDEYFEGIKSIGAESFAVLHSGCKMLVLFSCAETLDTLTREIQKQRTVAESFSLPFPIQVCRMLEIVAEELQNPDWTKNRQWIEVEQFAGFASDVKLTESFLQCVRAYLFNRSHEAVAAGEEGYQLFKSSLDCSTFLVPEHAFYYGLILAAAPDTQVVPAMNRLRRIVKLFQIWSELCPQNYEHKYLLLKAESARLSGLWHRAVDLYEAAIQTAKRDGYLQNEAIANECAAKLFLARKQPKIAQVYLAEARYLYSRWGAHGKVQQLEDTYGYLLNLGESGDKFPGLISSAISSSTKEPKRRQLDIATILKVSQAISSEIRLDQLLSTLLLFAIESAGAESGYWILKQDEEWVIAASATADGTADIQKTVLVHMSDDVSFGVVQYALRTQELVILHHASREGRFVRDPHIRKKRAKSILCLPVLKQGKIVAILYLENSLATHVFTSDRIELLILLSGQMAISMENAMMYESLDRLVIERTNELKRTQQQMIESEKMASLGQLTAGVAHEINNPINFVVSSTAPLRRDIEDLIELLKSYREAIREQGLVDKFQAIMNKEEQIDLDYTVEEVLQLVSGIEEGGSRTAEIVKGLRAFSRLDEDDVKLASVTEGIDSTLTLLHRSYERRIRIVRDYEDVPEIECYPGKLNQVYMNLLSNAIQAIPDQGEIRISVRHIEEFVQIRISDTGVGISKEVMRRIFEPFFTTKEVGLGTGLGLSISYGIIELHHGRIEVDSRLGQGTTFTITLPIRQTGNVLQ